MRVVASFFDRLGELLPEQRGVEGTPSATDYPQIRVLITAGMLVPFMSISAVLSADDSIELIYLELG